MSGMASSKGTAFLKVEYDRTLPLRVRVVFRRGNATLLQGFGCVLGLMHTMAVNKSCAAPVKVACVPHHLILGMASEIPLDFHFKLFLRLVLRQY